MLIILSGERTWNGPGKGSEQIKAIARTAFYKKKETYMAQAYLSRNSGISLFMIVAVMLWMGLAAAPANAAQAQGPCANDLQKFCRDVQPGGGRIAKCLKEHQNDLSPACKQQIAELKKQVHEFQEACEDDAMKLCAGVKPGGGRIFRCLKEHESELSPECKEKMEVHKAH